MYILAFLLLIISLSKLLLLGFITWEELKSCFTNIEFSTIKVILLSILVDSLIGTICSLYILI